MFLLDVSGNVLLISFPCDAEKSIDGRSLSLRFLSLFQKFGVPFDFFLYRDNIHRHHKEHLSVPPILMGGYLQK